MLSHPASKPQSPAASGTRAGKTAGGAAGEFKEAPPIAKPRRPLSSIQAAAGVDPGYPDGAAARTVRFQLPSSATSEPSPLLKARGPEYVTVTRVAPERERRPALPPSPLPVPVPTSLGAYGYPYTYGSPADASAKRASVIANVGVAVNAAPATYPTRIGPIKLMKTLNGGTFGASYVAHDHGTGRIVCARVFKKARLSVEAKIKQGLLVEARCYKIIAASLARDRAHLMELHGILQDDERVFFVMVSPDRSRHSPDPERTDERHSRPAHTFTFHLLLQFRTVNLHVDPRIPRIPASDAVRPARRARGDRWWA